MASSDTGSKALLRGCRFAQDCVLSVPWKVYCSGDWRDERDILVTLQVIRLEHSATRHTYKAKYCVWIILNQSDVVVPFEKNMVGGALGWEVYPACYDSPGSWNVGHGRCS